MPQWWQELRVTALERSAHIRLLCVDAAFALELSGTQIKRPGHHPTCGRRRRAANCNGWCHRACPKWQARFDAARVQSLGPKPLVEGFKPSHLSEAGTVSTVNTTRHIRRLATRGTLSHGPM